MQIAKTTRARTTDPTSARDAATRADRSLASSRTGSVALPGDFRTGTTAPEYPGPIPFGA